MKQILSLLSKLLLIIIISTSATSPSTSSTDTSSTSTDTQTTSSVTSTTSNSDITPINNASNTTTDSVDDKTELPDEIEPAPMPGAFQLGQLFNYFKLGDDWTGDCPTGTEQSPIDVSVQKGVCDNQMVLDLQILPQEFQVEEHHKFYTLQSDGNFTNLYATDIFGQLFGYTAWQFHLHSPSEHTIDGKQYDLEMHIVHYMKPEFNAPQRKFAVVALLFEVSDQSQPFFEQYKMDQKFDESVFNMADVLGTQIPLDPIYYTYIGSLTTPPCSEIVNWYILDVILPISRDQLNVFSDRFQGNRTFAGGNGNNRRTQALNGREIKKGGIVCQEQFIYFFSFFILYIFINYFIFKLL